MENYFESQRDQIFRNVEVLIYVFDVESQDHAKDMATFLRCLSAIEENSKDARVFCLIHKMDLIPTDQGRQEAFQQRAHQLTSHANVVQITCFGTSIWDETLYKAWSAVVYSLVPNVERLRGYLQNLCVLCQADEVVLFETATFLVIASADNPELAQLLLANKSKSANSGSNGANGANSGAGADGSNGGGANGDGALVGSEVRPPADAHRYEKMSNIIKQFKLSCAKTQSSFQSLEVASSKVTVIMEKFTANTCIMVVVSHNDGTGRERVQSAGIRLNLLTARALFEKFVNA